jgi:hypothetical protein
VTGRESEDETRPPDPAAGSDASVNPAPAGKSGPAGDPASAAGSRAAAKKEHYWTLEKVGTAIALGAFLFGFGSFAQARDLFTGAAARRQAQQQEQQALDRQQQATRTQQRNAAIGEYIARADSACQPFASQDSSRPARFDQAADAGIRDLRVAMLRAWQAVPWGSLPSDEIPRVRKMWSEFQAANDFWAAVSVYAGTGDLGAESSALGLYTTAENAFEADAGELGFRWCGHSWPNLLP